MATDTIIHASLTLRDAKGFIGKIFYHVAGDSSVSTNLADMATVAETFSSAVLALTNCAQQTASWPFTFPGLAFGTNAEYRAEFMKAVYTFSTDKGQLARFKIPAPKLAQTDTDGVTVKNDGSVTIVVDFVNAVKNPVNSAFISTAAGDPYTHFEGGIVKFGKEQKRVNGRVKSAGLVAGEGE